MPRKSLCFASLLFAALVILPGDVVGQAKKNNQQPMAATDQDYIYLEHAKQVLGQILSFDDSAKTVSVRVEGTDWVRNPSYKPMTNQYVQLMQHQGQLAQAQMQVARSRTRGQAQGHMRQIARLQGLIGREMSRLNNVNPNNLPFKAQKHTRDFDLVLEDKIVYRKMTLGLEYDDTGNAKTYSKAEIAKLKGNDSTKPGYTATASEFHPNQIVYIYLSPAKKHAKSSPSATAIAADKDAKEAGDNTGLDKATVRMLIIDKEGASVAIPKTPKKKK
jgi:hypothetical protein